MQSKRKIHVTPSDQMREIKLGCADLIGEAELLDKLTKSYAKDQGLRVKFGADPSRPDLHLGHSVGMNKLKLLQDFGHEILFVIGDFTARIGDPTDKNKLRPQLSEQEIDANVRTYEEQVFKILDREKTNVIFNSQWLNALSPAAFIKLMASHTIQQLLAREDFSKRYAEQSPLFFHELLYPVLQGYDSVHLHADIELGGTDQRFNLLFGREMQKQAGQSPQVLLITPLLEGLDGVIKMSKSLDNYIGLADSPKDMFGKTMSISDTHMLRFYELLSRKGQTYVEQVKDALTKGSLHPMEAKKNIAQEIVAQYWGESEGLKARQEFENLFSKNILPQDLVSHTLSLPETGFVNLLELSVSLGFSQSKGEARRILQQRGMRIDDEVMQNEKIELFRQRDYIFRQGKLHMVKLSVV
ncbi:MAG: tyrosine--tRNA ligase [Oligoflexales bacterium]|nr:tyrosine--tRNA ligase [Oligoflexales bacterium]